MGRQVQKDCNIKESDAIKEMPTLHWNKEKCPEGKTLCS